MVFMLIVISKLKNRLLALIRIFLALAIVALLLGQLYGIIFSGGAEKKDIEHPGGNPMKVYRYYPEGNNSREPQGGFITWLKNYYCGY